MGNADISIIIATRNREKILWQTVTKACQAIENKNAEIIIVNDGDNELTVPGGLINKINYFNNPGKGVSSARNFGASKSKGTILFFLDDDMWMNTESIAWINKALLKESPADAVYFINWVYPPELYQQLRSTKMGKYLLAANYDKLWGRMGQNGEQPAGGLYEYGKIGSCSLVMTKQIFERSGGYNESIFFAGEDVDLENKINKMGLKMYVVFDVTLFHNHQNRLEIKSYLSRVIYAQESEIQAMKDGFIKPIDPQKYSGSKKYYFEFFRIAEPGLILLHKLLPNIAFLEPLNNKIIGVLSGLQKYKTWRKIFYKAK